MSGFLIGPCGVAPASAAANPTVSFVNSFASAGGGTSQNTATIDIGNPAYIGTRRVILVLCGGSNAINLSSGTINGVPIDRIDNIVNGINTDDVTFCSAPVPSGTTAVSVVLNWSGTQSSNPRVGVYIVDGSLLSSIIPVIGSHEVTTGLTADSATVATLSGGFILAGAFVGGASAGPTITASDAGLATDFFANGQAYMGGSANNTPASAASNVTISWSTASSNAMLALAAWR